MSDDPTKNIGEKYTTQPTIQTVLERIAQMEERIGIRLDRIEGEVKLTHSELYELRADFRELRNSIKEHFPAVVK